MQHSIKRILCQKKEKKYVADTEQSARVLRICLFLFEFKWKKRKLYYAITVRDKADAITSGGFSLKSPVWIILKKEKSAHC